MPYSETRERQALKTAGTKMRVDLLLFDGGHAPSIERARALILAGRVLVGEQKIDKPGARVPADSIIRLLGVDPPYVSRGGLKLAAALEHWEIAVTGRACLDVGASTGGFTDCLLNHGALRVHAIDTGTGQIDWRLRSDPRVVLHEGFNARYLELADLGEPVDLAVCDVSFISATAIIPAITRVLKPEAGRMIVLVKPQFEVSREQVGEGGIVRDAALQEASCAKVRACVEESNFTTQMMESPITGAEGNKEFLLYARR